MIFFFFFFKQKTAYEMLRSLVGSEMCIRDRNYTFGRWLYLLAASSNAPSNQQCHNTLAELLECFMVAWYPRLHGSGGFRWGPSEPPVRDRGEIAGSVCLKRAGKAEKPK
eukprot:TRINITY_DN1101_c0_g1_i6.p1 TRINITY_DN1101_c0_g1~~TRINITY_DN1101_c0_g1_i6.p1  ORF type:complete len:110 (+),score=16.60 TRINITY_DN1101_c0_g1_i6:108-437(+)